MKVHELLLEFPRCESIIMFNYDVLKIEVHPNLILSIWFRDDTTGKIKFLPEHLTGVLQPLTKQKVFEKAFVEGGVVRWQDELDVSPKSMYDSIKQQRRVGCLTYTA